MLSVQKNKSVALREQKKDYYLEQKRALLSLPEVMEKISDDDFLITKAGTSTPIRSIQDEELVKKVASTTMGICRDLGVKDWKNPEVMKYTSVRFLQVLKKHYKDFTIAEVKLAFEMAMLGELDEWLPKDRDGNANANHYQEFSMEYYTRILKAFTLRKNKAWLKVTKLKPVLALPISQEERKKNRDAFFNDIYTAFDKYKEKKVAPNFVINIFLNEFIKQGLLPKPEPTEETLNKAFTQYIFSKPNKYERKKVSDNYHLGNYLAPLMSIAENKQGNIMIAQYFDKLVKEGKDLREFLKNE